MNLENVAEIVPSKPALSALDANVEQLETLKLESFVCTVETFSNLNAPNLRRLVFAADEDIKVQVQELFPGAKISMSRSAR